MSGEQYPTLGSVFPLIHGILENHLNEMKPNDPEEVKFFKQKVIAAIKKDLNLENTMKMKWEGQRQSMKCVMI